MAKAYWITTYRSISDPAKLAKYAVIAGPAILARRRQIPGPQRRGALAYADPASRRAPC